MSISTTSTAPFPSGLVIAPQLPDLLVPVAIRRGVFGKMVANNPPDIVPIPLADVVGRIKTVPLDSDLIKTARAIGVSLGD